MGTAQVINARSPLRVDFVGMTDFIPACQKFGGVIVNATINKYIYASLVPRYDRRIILRAPDQNDLVVEIESPAKLDSAGPLGLAQEIISRFTLEHGFELTTYSEMPGGAGLGSSSTITTCIIAVLDALTGYTLTSHEMAEMAQSCETAALNVTYGWQDQYSPVTGGGVKLMKYWPQQCGWHVEVNQVPMTPGSLAELERSMVVAYSGLSRPAGMILDAVAQGVRAEDPAVIAALQAMNLLAQKIRLRLLKGEIHALGGLLTEVWDQHKLLHPEVTNERLEELWAIAMNAGASGGRVCGAGGGGTMLFMASPNREYAVRQALREADARIFDCTIDSRGLLIW